MIVARQMDGRDFARPIIDNFDEMLDQARRQPLVMGIALHPYIVGQPKRVTGAMCGSPRPVPSAATSPRWPEPSSLREGT